MTPKALIRHAARDESFPTHDDIAVVGERIGEPDMGANAKVVQQAYAAFGKGDIAAVIAMLDDNVEWTSPRTLPHGGEFNGPAQVGKFFEGIGAAWDSLDLDVESVDDAGKNVLGVLRADGTRKGGAKQSYGAVHVFDVSNGKIRRFREYVDLPSSLA